MYSSDVMSCFFCLFLTSNHLHLFCVEGRPFTSPQWPQLLVFLLPVEGCCPQIEGLETKIAKNNNTTEAGNQTIYRHPYPSDNGILSKNQATLMKLMNQILEQLDFRRVKESSPPLQQPSTSSKNPPSLRLLFLRRFERGDCGALIQPDGLKTTHASHPRGRSD